MYPSRVHQQRHGDVTVILFTIWVALVVGKLM